MADYFLRSVGGNDANDGLSWATARATLLQLLAIPIAAGDTVYVADDHVETSSAVRTWSFPGTPALPNKLISVKGGVFPVAAPVGVPAFNSTGTSTLNIAGSFVAHGCALNSGSGSVQASIFLVSATGVDAIQAWNDSDLFLTNGHGSSVIGVGSSSTGNSSRSRVLLNNCRLRLGTPSQSISIYQEFTWRGGKLAAGTAASYLFRVGAQGRSCPVMIEGVDFTDMATTTDLVSGPNSGGRVLFRNCSLPAGWTGQPVQGLMDPGLRVELHNCDSIDTNYRLWIMAFMGSIQTSIATVKTGGASDGVTAYSWKVSTNANPTPGALGLETGEIFRWNETINAPITVGLDVFTTGAALTNADAWLEVQYLGTSGLPLGSFTSNKSSPIVAPTQHPASAAVWNASGQSQRLSVTFTPREIGAIHVRLVLAKPNTDLYVDPKPQVS